MQMSAANRGRATPPLRCATVSPRYREGQVAGYELECRMRPRVAKDVLPPDPRTRAQLGDHRRLDAQPDRGEPEALAA